MRDRDVGFVRELQFARAEFIAFPGTRYGAANGVVEQISAEARVNEETQQRYYVVNVSLHHIPDEYFPALRSGMEANVQIVTGKRPIYHYFLAPFIDGLGEALGER